MMLRSLPSAVRSPPPEAEPLSAPSDKLSWEPTLCVWLRDNARDRNGRKKASASELMFLGRRLGKGCSQMLYLEVALSQIMGLRSMGSVSSARV